ncbi:D-alanyl-D-alanine endopeptidase [Niveibacterium sp.]|uniref:D-alanyl-D-alanine endopeptidase n=1 Tax=Niveibacterium sp. TaxID=2017444 RepID=UPI0035B1037B
MQKIKLITALVFAAAIAAMPAQAKESHAKTPAKKTATKTATKASSSHRSRTVKTSVSSKKGKRVSPAKALYRDMKSAKTAPVRAVPVSLDREGNPLLQSNAFMVQDLGSGKVLLERNAESVVPIASITKLMTAMVVLDAKLSLSETLTVTDEDTDKLKNTTSRLVVGTELTREEMIHLALMSSENRAAASLGRNYPGGINAFVFAMNRKAQALGLSETVFHDSTGLNPQNVSSARDLAKMVTAASHYPLIRQFSTDDEETLPIRGREQTFRNTNALVRSPDWQIGVSKTGFINEAGRCLVMQAWLAEKPMVIVLLDSVGKFTRVADAQRIKRWVESALAHQGGARIPAG